MKGKQNIFDVSLVGATDAKITRVAKGNCGITINYGSKGVEFKTGKNNRVTGKILDALKEAIKAEKKSVNRENINLE